jgi:carbamoyl-phosphate synthase large subunit
MSLPRKVLILGGSPDQCELVKGFNARGFETYVVDINKNCMASKFAKHFFPISTIDFESLVALIYNFGIDLITTCSSEKSLQMVAQLNFAFGFNSVMTTEQITNVTNKGAMKQKLKANQINTGDFWVLRIEDFETFKISKFPVIIKPADSSGGRGVTRVVSNEFMEAELLKSLKFSKSKEVIVEVEYMGIEVSVDAIVQKGVVETILVSQNERWKHDGSIGRFARTISPILFSRTIQIKIENCLREIARVFELENTVFFVQMFINGDEIFVVELGARIAGGSKIDLVRSAANVDLVDLQIRLQLGERIYGKSIPSTKLYAMNYIYMHPGTFHEIRIAADSSSPINLVGIQSWIPSGTLIKNNANGTTRVGYFLVDGVDIQEVNLKTVEIEARLAVLDKDGIDLMVKDIYV